ncbi:MAG: ATP-dependent DNA helicase RecQ [Saprospiraceae bacterium]
MSKILISNAVGILNQYWGFDTFYSEQEKIILSILEGNNTICLMPTGGGKSLCFQVPALYFDGVCIVVSPLLALIDDQVFRLKSHSIPAEGLHSGMSQKEQNKVISRILDKELKLLYISPERLQSDKFRDILKNIEISFVAVDESHCISQWGYDFRPEYRMIHNIKNIFPDIQMAAFTASANKQVLNDIREYLDIGSHNLFRSSFLKSNIIFSIIKSGNKMKILLKLLDEFSGSGIIYMRSRLGTEKISEKLNNAGYISRFYHAGLSSKERQQIQTDWLRDEFDIIVSTTAFGMGIDKPNVRFVIHFDLPTSMEEYYQEAGRAGRDKLQSHAVIIYNERDIVSMKSRDLDNFPTYAELKQTLLNLIKYIDKNMEISLDFFDIDDFTSVNNIGKLKTYNAIIELERYGIVDLNINPKERESTIKVIKIIDSNLKNEFSDKEIEVLDFLILNYNNITISNIRFTEKSLSDHLNLSDDEIFSILNSLKNKKIIEYERRNIALQLIVNKSKVNSISKNELEFRRKRIENNINVVSNYLDLSECRQKYILKYFDENLQNNCYSCDICNGVYERNISKDIKSNFERKYNQIEIGELIELEELIYLDSYINRFKYLSMLKKYITEGKFEVFGDKFKKNY